MNIQKTLAANLFLLTLVFILACTQNSKDSSSHNSLFEYDGNQETRWSSPENMNGEKGTGGKETNTTKGHDYDSLPQENGWRDSF